MSMVVNFYTDGACSGNQNDDNVGGWGAILEYGDTVKELHAGELNTTNNRMELDAVINAFRQLKRNGLRIHVFTDSSYVANCFINRWYESWRKKGWKNSKKQPVENRERWEELLSMVEQNDVTFFRVKGHMNLDSGSADPEKAYRKFLENNRESLAGEGAPAFSPDDFRKIVDMNNRADELANIAMDELR